MAISNFLNLRLTHLILSLCILFSLTQCSSSWSAREQVAHSAIHTFAQDAAVSDGLSLGLSGWTGFDPNFYLYFDTKGPVSLSHARTMLIKTTERFCEYMNSEKEFQLHYHHHKVSPKNLKIQIAFVDENDELINDGNISIIMLKDEKITYGYHTKFPGVFDIQKNKESYQEAKASIPDPDDFTIPEVFPSYNRIEIDPFREALKVAFEARCELDYN